MLSTRERLSIGSSALFFVCLVLWVSLFLQLSCGQQATPRCDVNGKIRTYENRIDKPVKKFVWLNNSLGDVEAIFVLTTGRTLYRSLDQGVTFEDLSNKVTSPIDDIVTTANSKKLYFVGDNLWATEDQGDHFSMRSGELRIRSVKAHPTQADWALAQAISPACYPVPHAGCSWDLYLTQSLGASWEKKASFVAEDQYDWGDAGQDGVPIGNVYYINYPAATPSSNQGQLSLRRYEQSFQATPDLFKTHDSPRPHAIAFKFFAGTLLVAVATSASDESLLELWASHDDGKSYGLAAFPTTLYQKSYHIADLSEGTAVVSVDHIGGGPWSTTYISDNMITKFSTISNYTRRSTSTGRTDIKRIEALEGIYFINRYALSEENDRVTEDTPITSAVTFDKGGRWQAIQPPARDLQGGSPCSGCSLHLVPFSKSRRGSKALYSKADTPGILLATGNVGPALNDRPDQINTYISRDAGMTWSQLAVGEHTYEMGDFGSLIVLARTNGATTNIGYTWDQGLSQPVVECAIATQALEIREIYNSPSGQDMSFIVHGTSPTSFNSYLIHVDFLKSEARTCDASDYEPWSPSDVLDDQCLLGQRTTYTRRKAASSCYNPTNYQKPTADAKPCACKREDLQCDYCFEPDKNAPDRCIFDTDCPTNPYVNPTACATQKTYNRTQGYRLVPGDKCSIAQADDSFTKLAPKEAPCLGGDGGNNHGDGSGGGLSGGAIFGILVLVFFVLVAVVGVVAYVLYRVNPEFREFVKTIPLPSASIFGGDKAYKGSGSHEYAALNTSEPQSILDDLEADENAGLDELLDDEPNELDDKSISTFTNQKKSAKDPLSGDGGGTSLL